ncbi:MAG: hypothetical protein HOV86_08650, partial [Thermoactinospora sp.]|nr:hypothetical protein [Thermoactinospora sp.]
WRERRHGRLTDDQLTAALADARRRAAAEARRSEQQAKRVAEDLTKARAGKGPASDALGRQRWLLEQSQAAQVRYAAAVEAARETKARMDSLDEQLDRNPLARRLTGGRRTADLQADRTRTYQELTVHQRDALEADDAAGRLSYTAGVPRERVSAELASLNARWDTAREEAIAADVNAIEAERRVPEALLREAFDRETGAVRELEAEQQRRGELPEQQREAEADDRAQELAAEQQRRQAEQARQAEEAQRREAEIGPEIG